MNTPDLSVKSLIEKEDNIEAEMKLLQLEIKQTELRLQILKENKKLLDLYIKYNPNDTDYITKAIKKLLSID